MVAHVSDPRFLVLHGLRLKGFAPVTALAAVTGIDDASIEGLVEQLRADGLAQHRDGRVTGWSLTPAGRACHADQCVHELALAACRGRIEEAYRRFLEVNGPFLELCTDWQVRRGSKGVDVPNDHTDAAYDAGVLARLRDVDAAVQPVCTRLAEIMERFARYGSRLTEARARAEAGEHAWLTGALIDSYHTVWFELHEDLLATLGIAREREGDR